MQEKELRMEKICWLDPVLVTNGHVLQRDMKQGKKPGSGMRGGCYRPVNPVGCRHI